MLPHITTQFFTLFASCVRVVLTLFVYPVLKLRVSCMPAALCPRLVARLGGGGGESGDGLGPNGSGFRDFLKNPLFFTLTVLGKALLLPRLDGLERWPRRVP
jgi:hypothetical protein